MPCRKPMPYERLVTRPGTERRSPYRRRHERRLGHDERLAALTYLDADRLPHAEPGIDEGEADSLAQCGREGPGRDDADRIALPAVGDHPHARARDASPCGDDAAQHSTRSTLALGQQ